MLSQVLSRCRLHVLLRSTTAHVGEVCCTQQPVDFYMLGGCHAQTTRSQAMEHDGAVWHHSAHTLWLDAATRQQSCACIAGRHV